jgi:hypothetical protein
MWLLLQASASNALLREPTTLPLVDVATFHSGCHHPLQAGVRPEVCPIWGCGLLRVVPLHRIQFLRGIQAGSKT